PLLRPTISPPVRESTRRSPAWRANVRSIQRASKSTKSCMVRSDPTILKAAQPLICAIGSPVTDDGHPRALSPSLSAGGRCTLPLREFTVYPYGSMAREATRAIRFLGLRAYSMVRRKQTLKEAPYQNRIKITCIEPSEDIR